jgi:hypothetical protein
MVFDHFIFDDAHTGFGNGHLGKRDSGVCGGEGGGAEDGVDLLLRKVGIFTLGFFYTFNQCIKFGDIGYGHGVLLKEVKLF